MDLAGEAYDQINAALSSIIPAGRMGDVEDQVEAVLFLASRENSFVVGQELVVDGGLVGCKSLI